LKGVINLAITKTKDGTGLKKEASAALAYVLGPVTGIIFLIMEKDPFVKFHAMQSIIVSLAFLVLSWLFAWLGPLAGLLWIAGFALWLWLIYKAYQGEKWHVPFLGQWVEKLI